MFINIFLIIKFYIIILSTFLTHKKVAAAGTLRENASTKALYYMKY